MPQTYNLDQMQKKAFETMNRSAEIYGQQSIEQNRMDSLNQLGTLTMGPTGKMNEETATKIVEMMKVDLVSAERLKDAYPDLYERAHLEMENDRATAAMSNAEKRKQDFFGTRRRAARNRVAAVDQNRQKLIDTRREVTKKKVYQVAHAHKHTIVQESLWDLADKEKQALMDEYGESDLEQMSTDDLLAYIAKTDEGAPTLNSENEKALAEVNKANPHGQTLTKKGTLSRDVVRAVQPMLEANAGDQIQERTQQTMKDFFLLSKNTAFERTTDVGRKTNVPIPRENLAERATDKEKEQATERVVKQANEFLDGDISMLEAIPGFMEGKAELDSVVKNYSVIHAYYAKYQQYNALAKEMMKSGTYQHLPYALRHDFITTLKKMMGPWELCFQYSIVLKAYLNGGTLELERDKPFKVEDTDISEYLDRQKGWESVYHKLLASNPNLPTDL